MHGNETSQHASISLSVLRRLEYFEDYDWQTQWLKCKLRGGEI